MAGLEHRHMNYAKILPFYTLTDYNVEREFINTSRRFENLINNEKFECLLKENKYDQIFSPSNMTPWQYLDEDEFIKKNRKSDECLNIFALNIRSLPKHGGEQLYFLKNLHTKFYVIVLTAIGSKNISVVEKLIPDYNFHYVLPAKKQMWRRWYLHLKFIDQCYCKGWYQARHFMWLRKMWDRMSVHRILFFRCTTYIVGGIYRHPNGNVSHFISDFEAVLIDNDKTTVLARDMNIDIIQFSNEDVVSYVTTLMSYGYLPYITLPSRITNLSMTCIDQIFVRLNRRERVLNI